MVLVRAIETSDPAYEVLSQGDREFATREARRHDSGPAIQDSGASAPLSQAGRPRERTLKNSLSGEEEVFFVRRARHLQERLAKKFPALADTKDFSAVSVVFSIAIVAFLLGIATNALGESNRVNIIAFPLLGMLAWNVGVYLLLSVGWFGTRGRTVRVQSHPQQRAVMALMLPSRMLKSHAAPNALAAGIRRYHDDWTKLAAPLYSARAKYVLHFAAALLALGAVAGMYLRGIGLEYLAGWESTFLSERDLRSLLKFVLAPASALTGIALPDERQIAALRWSATQPGENAARWIHLWAMTAVLVIVAPRIALAVAAWVKKKRLASDFRLPDEPYFRRLLRRNGGERVRLLPCSYQPSDEVRENIRKSLARVLGESARVEVDEGAPYGAEESTLAGISEPHAALADFLVVLFNLATTPEEENHQFLLRGLQRLIADGRVARELLALVDESSYRARLASDSPRIEERRKAWRDLLAPYRHAFVNFDESDHSALETVFGSGEGSS